MDHSSPPTPGTQHETLVKRVAGRRVLHLDRGREMRGGQHQALLLIRGLQELGVEQLLLARLGSPLAEATAASGIPVEELGFSALKRFGRWAEVIHAHDADSHVRAALAGCRPLVVGRRVAFPIRRSILSRWKYRNADVYIAVSRHVARILIEYGVDASKVRVVYDGVPSMPVPVSRRDVVALESDDEGKCNGLIREAAALGGFNVRFSRDLPEALKYAKLFIYLSRSEGFGSAAVLAMAAGVPVVATRLPALEEVFSGNDAGTLVENDPAAVAAVVRKFIDDERMAGKCADAARSVVAPRYTVRNMVDGTLAVYEELW
ncbi:MAG: glycosyltransferase family 4 protein [Bryobacterales bacterium]|nr:glycosyltransferase family 4 protein [Bryobacterales bacterium]